MKYNFNEILKDIDENNITQPVYEGTETVICGTCGNPVNKPKKTGDEDVTLALISKSALLNLSEDEAKLSGDDKNDRAELAMKIKSGIDSGEETDIDVKEAALIRDLIDKKYAPIVVNRARAILDKKEN